MADALQINDRKSLAHWLEDKPGEFAQIIALRAALRVFPLVLQGWSRAKAPQLDVERFQVLSSLSRNSKPCLVKSQDFTVR